ncbi:MAG: hypothetical protein IJD11_01420 [Oscillospiraceae bacterium]|nr:hypothetical protein [Oscillospiraceae bacterium]
MKHKHSKRKWFSAALAVLLLSGSLCTFMSAEQAAEDTDANQPSNVTWTTLTGSEPVTVAEKGGKRLVVTPETAQFYIEDIATQTRWYGKPTNMDTVEGMKGAEKVRVQSYLMLDVVDTTVDNTVISLTSESDSVFESGMTVEQAENTVRFTYEFPSYELTVPLQLTLTEKGFKAEVPLSEVKEQERYQLRTVTVLPFFDAGYYEEEGFLFVPDGSGAVMNFNNGKGSFQKYEQTVYGYDYAISRYSYNGKEQEVRMPIFGIAHTDRFMLAVIDDGAADASVVAGTNTNKNKFNYAHAKFTTRIKDVLLYIHEQRTDLDIFQSTPLPSRTLSIDYQLEAVGTPTYVNMAESYRQYLLDTESISKEQVKSDALYIDLYGATVRTKPKLGIPMEQEEPLTTFAQAEEILENLHKIGAKNVVVRYYKWSPSTIWKDMTMSHQPASCLGGTGGLNRLKEKATAYGYSIYLDVNPISFHKGGPLAFFADYAQDIRNYTIELFPYDFCTNVENSAKKVTYLVKRELLKNQFIKADQDVQKLGVTGLSLSGTQTLYNDFRILDSYRDQTRVAIQKATEGITASLMVENGNIYAIKNAAHIVEAPSSSSGFDITDQSVPFYQIVLHGAVSYANEAIDANPDVEASYLRALETGASLRFGWTYSEVDVLAGSDDEALYYANYDHWKTRAEQMISESADYYQSIIGSRITDHKKLADGVYVTDYDNGVYIVVNYTEKEVETAYGKVKAEGFLTGRKAA